MRIPDEVLEAVRSRVSIVDAVGRHVALKRAGRNWKGLCPFHAEKTPSFVVNEERGTYHCFGCGAGGSVFRFLMEVEGRSFTEVVGSLAAEVGVTLPRGANEDPGARRERAERDALLDVLSLAQRYYRHQLEAGRAGGPARDYLTRREVGPAVAEAFGLGCAPAGWDHLARYLRGKGVDLSVAATAGLVAPRASGNGFYDRLRDRLVFPIQDGQGRVVSFGGRVLGEGEPKYLNGPESPVFRKSEVLYGLPQAAEAVRRERRALLVEGYLDVISLHARGVSTALATLGTALTADHIRALRRRADEVVLVYDGDEAGRRAAFRSLDLFLSERYPCRGILLPPGEDPDSFMRGGGDLASLAASARPLLELYLEESASRFDLTSVEGRVAAVDDLASRLAVVSDALARDLYVKQAAEALEVDEAHLRTRLRAGSRRPGAAAPTQGDAEVPEDPIERSLLACLLAHPEHRQAFRSRGVEEWLRPGPLKEAARFVAARSEAAEQFPVDEAPEAARRALTRSLVDDRAPNPGYPQVEAALRVRHLSGRTAALVREIARAERGGDAERVLALQREKTALDRALSECRRPHPEHG
ncbi:MAG: DNA primase [Deferrisomatales bacterium]|nr:DNA primase [Deferrisomatales bacterium]